MGPQCSIASYIDADLAKISATTSKLSSSILDHSHNIIMILN